MMSANDAEGEEEVEILWENPEQEIPMNATSVIVGKDIPYIEVEAFRRRPCLKKVDMSGAYSLEIIEHRAFLDCISLSIINWAPNLITIGNCAFRDCTSLEEADMSKLHALEIIGDDAFSGCSALVRVMLAPNLRYHWFVEGWMPFDETHHKLLSVDMEGHDLKKAIRIKNMYPRATPNLTTKRLVSMYAKSPLTFAQLEDAARDDGNVTEVDWERTWEEDLRRLVEIQKAYADSIFMLVHWYAGNGLVENLIHVNSR